MRKDFLTDAATGLNPRAIALVDVDGNGDLDLVTANDISGNVSVLFNDGSGVFGSEVQFPAGSNPVAVASADFDRIGRPDLVVVNGAAAGGVSVLLAAGLPGNFGAATFFPAGESPNSVAIGDFDRNGKLDLAVANPGTSVVTILLGDGNGAFGPSSSILAGPRPGSIVAADINRDGWLDLVVANRAAAPDNTVSILESNGLGTFKPRVSFTMGVQPEFVAVGDLDSDGDLDLVTTDSVSSKVTVRLRNGAGGFSAEASYSAGAPARELVLGDVNGDGVLDLVASDLSSSEVTVLQGSGDGKFGAPTRLATSACANQPVIGDVDGDGPPDLLVGSGCSNAVGVFLNTLPACPNASFGPAERVFSTGIYPFGVAAGDFNLDGRLDLATANNSSGNVSVLLASGPGSFSAATDLAAGTQPVAILTSDLNGDSKLDLAVANSGSNNVSVFLATTPGAFGPATNFTAGTAPQGVAAADFDGDGKTDLAVSNNGSSNVSILKGTGAGSFGAPSNTALSFQPGGIAAGDFNGDGRPDLAVVDYTNARCWILINNGVGGFGPPTPYVVGTNPRAVALGDFDRNGTLDFATANEGADNVTVRLGVGNGTFGVLSSFPLVAGADPYSVAVGDLNGDFKPDLVTADFSTDFVLPLRTVRVLLGDGAGGFGPATAYRSGAVTSAVLVADFTGDGSDDVVAAQPFDNNVGLLAGDGAGGLTVSPSYPTGGTSIGAISNGDFDRNGTLDVVVSSEKTGVSIVSILLGDGAGGFGVPSTVNLGGGSRPRGSAVADLDREGDLDIAVADFGKGRVAILHGNGFGGFPTVTPVSVGVGNPLDVTVGDFDRNGIPDLATANEDSANVTILRGVDGLSYMPPAQIAVPMGPRAIVTGDFNRDGRLDLAVVSATSHSMTVLLGQGDGTFPVAGRTDYPTGALSAPWDLAAGDLDGDGILDLAVTDHGTNQNQLRVFKGTVTGAFAGPTNFFVGPDASSVVLGDFNRDGRLDVAVATQALIHEEVVVLLNNGAGFDAPVVYGAGSGWLTAGDLNDDGRLDLAASDFGVESVVVLLNTACRARRMVVAQDVSSCDAPGSPFAQQPILEVVDDGFNRSHCDAGMVTAAIVPGTGNPLATLSGTNPEAVLAGVATFGSPAPLSIDQPGRRYQLDFTHGTATRVRSATFSQTSVAIAGNTPICSLATETYDAGLGYDSYAWTLDAAPYSTFQQVSLTGLSAGNHTLAVTVAANGCSASDALVVAVDAPLGGVTISTPGSLTVCTACTGGLLTATDAGGGMSSHRWGYRTVSGPPNPITTIPGETASTYTLDGADFPGSGTYYVVEETTPSCGSAIVSNELQVTVYTAPPSDDVQFFTVTSTSEQNVLEWLNPAAGPYETTRIRYNPGPLCTFPSNPLADGTLLTEQNDDGVGSKGTFVHTTGPGSNGTTFCYTAFVQKDVTPTYSAGRTTSGRPFDTSGRVKWAYSTGAATLAPPGLGGAGTYAVSNDRALHGMGRGVAGGTWPQGPPAWQPLAMNGPAQGRPPVIPLAVGPASRVVIVGSQDGFVYAVDADRGTQVWRSAVRLGDMVQAGVAGMFRAFGAAFDYLFVGTRNSATPNVFYALNLADGSIAARFDNGGGANAIGIIGGAASIDIPNKKAYFASRAAGSPGTLWCLDIGLNSLTPCAGSWPVALGNVDGSPTLRRGRVYVGNNVGTVYAVNGSDGTVLWSLPTAVEPVKGFVFTDRFTDRLYVSTTSKVWVLNDDGSSASKPFPEVSVPNPSVALYDTGNNRVYVGGSDGRLYQIDVAGALPVVTSVPLGASPTVAVGAPGLDVANGLVYVGTDAGIVYAVQVPLP